MSNIKTYMFVAGFIILAVVAINNPRQTPNKTAQAQVTAQSSISNVSSVSSIPSSKTKTETIKVEAQSEPTLAQSTDDNVKAEMLAKADQKFSWNASNSTVANVVIPEVKATSCNTTVDAHSLKNDMQKGSEQINFFLDYFIDKGFTCNGASYMTASLITESSLNSLKDEKCGFGFCGESEGLAQWRSTRLKELRKTCDPQGDRDCQLKFLIQELKQRGQYQPFLTDDVDNIKSTIAKYEGYATPGDRFEIATKILNNLK